jgi:transcriptional regulator with XRE-family HTH domain
VSEKLERQLAAFLRKKRGDMTYAQFSRKLGLPPSTLHRLESCQQSVTLRRLQQIMNRLKCSIRDIFPPHG